MADFIDKIADGINKGIATASTGSKTMLEKNKIYTIIKNIECEKSQLINIIGNKVYEYCVKNEGDIPRDVVISICNEINVRNARIAEQRKQIEALDAEMNNVKGVRPQPAGGGVVCGCGYPNNPGAKFCGRCGRQLF